MNIKDMHTAIGWQIIPDTSDEYKSLKSDIERLKQKYNTQLKAGFSTNQEYQEINKQPKVG